jgi:hypothetical protein
MIQKGPINIGPEILVFQKIKVQEYNIPAFLKCEMLD